MQATYTGTKGTHLLQAFVPNTYPSGATNPCPTCPSSFTYYTSNGNSTRQAGTLNLRRRLRITALPHRSCTLTRNRSTTRHLWAATPAPPLQNWLNRWALSERGLSNFDQRHNAQIQT